MELEGDALLLITNICFCCSSGKNDILAAFFTGGILHVFTCSSTAKSQSNKWRVSFDSGCLKGIEIPFHGVLILVGSDTGDNEAVWAEF